MRRRLVLGLVSLLVAAPPSRGEYNYHGPTELLLGLGTRALMICNGRFVSNRTLDQIYEQELKLDQMPVLPPGPDRRVAAGGRGRETGASRSVPGLPAHGAARPDRDAQHPARRRRFADFLLSSWVYTNARDLGRFGLPYLNHGKWPGREGASVMPESWIDFCRAPAPATAVAGHFYGAQWWLAADDRKGKDVPADADATAGNRGQYAIVVPSYDLVIVRRGLDWLPQEHSFPRWDLTREVLKAFPKPASRDGEALEGRSVDRGTRQAPRGSHPVSVRPMPSTRRLGRTPGPSGRREDAVAAWLGADSPDTKERLVAV